MSGNDLQWDQRADGSATGAQAVVHFDTSLSVILQTDGPLRPGFVSGPFLIDNRGTQPSVFFPGYANRLETGLGPSAPPIPITLGGLFPFTSGIRMDPYDDFGVASIVGRIQFFEADGVTPVAVSEVNAAPEPGSFLFLGLGGAAMLAWKTRARRGA